ncbi:MAG: 3-methyladenine DNA glycosylase [Hellea sp.]|nr:3-methyladenine DNA glycosylase [Hellea sp.]
MEKFATILHRAAGRHGGEDGLAAKVEEGLSHYRYNLADMSDDRWLAQFTKRIFQAGFSWKVVEAKWDGFETAFWKFNPRKCAAIDLDDMERLTSDTGIVRNPVKIKTVPKNAQMILNMAAKVGSADKFIRDWPSEDFIGLLDYLQKNGSHLGANTACYALRFSGVPAFILSQDVTAALIHAGIIDKPVTSKTAKRDVQAAFNAWADESGENISYVSRVLALSMDA